MRGATYCLAMRQDRRYGFNPRAPCGARLVVDEHDADKTAFQSTRPMRGATRRFRGYRQTLRFQSTRPMRGATMPRKAADAAAGVSIHAPHAGRDLKCRERLHACDVSIHAPHAGRDIVAGSGRAGASCFNPRAPCGARRRQRRRQMRVFMFQSTRPMRGATGEKYDYGRTKQVSIHAPHAGRDRESRSSRVPPNGFNPRAPCGARHGDSWTHKGEEVFQSTRPMRGATLCPARDGYA